MSAPFRLRVHGRSGHASMPGIADNALVKAAPLIEALAALPAGARRSARGRRLPRRRARRAAAAGEALERARAPSIRSPRELIEPLLSLTLSPTMIEASEQRNVVPARLRRDRRLPASCRGRRPRTSSRSCARRCDSASTRRTTSSSGSSVGRHALADGHAALGAGSRAGSARLEPGARLAPMCRAPASPTRTGCATRSARSRTGSSR